MKIKTKKLNDYTREVAIDIQWSEIESDFDGIVTEIKVDNGNPVEYNQILFTINPT